MTPLPEPVVAHAFATQGTYAEYPPRVAVFDNRPKAHYPGRVADSQIGQVCGPGTDGRELLVIDRIDYDETANRSTVYFRTATTADLVDFVQAGPGVGR